MDAAIAPVILAGTVAREKTSLALFLPDGGGLRLLRSATVDNDELPSIRPLLRRFLAQDLTSLGAACLGVESPPWPVTAPEVAAALGLTAVELIGDAEACAEWLATLAPEDLVQVTPEGTAAGPGARTEGIWIGLGEEPGLARVRRVDGRLCAGPPPAVPADLPRICRELREGSLRPLVQLLAELARALQEGVLYLGGPRIRSLLPPPAVEQLGAALRQEALPVPVVLIEKTPLPLWGAAWRAARQGPGAGEVA